MLGGSDVTDAIGLQSEQAKIALRKGQRTCCDRGYVSSLVLGLHAIGIADPAKIDQDHLCRCEEELGERRVVALKGYLGYLHVGPDSPNYVPYYELAARYQVPFILHTGDTYSTTAKVKYAHPMLVDDVAVDHRDVKFVLAHFGNPWLLDAAEIVYKNENVWADLSGLLVGDRAYFQAMSQQGYLEKLAARVWEAIEYTERPDRFLYGTDWPLAPMSAYREFIRRVIPEPYQKAVFEDNARRLFRL
jgi:predicted TIM-barrel fold metal-dependent hydrolase